MNFSAGYIEQLIKEKDNIIIYHFHPGVIIIEDALKSEDYKGLKESTKTKLKSNMRVDDAMPSGTDLGNMIGYSAAFYKLHPDGKMSYKICSHHGVTEFKLTEKGKEFYKSPARDPVLFGYTGEMMGHIAELYSQLVADKKIGEVEKIREILSNIDIEHKLEFTFTPYDKILK